MYWFCKRYIYIINIKLRRKFTYDLLRRNIIDSHICSCEKKRYHVFFSLFVENILIFDCLFRHNGCPLVTGLLESCLWTLTVKFLLWTFWWPFVSIKLFSVTDLSISDHYVVKCKFYFSSSSTQNKTQLAMPMKHIPAEIFEH